METKQIEEQFLEAVKDHKLTVLHVEGVYRYMTFAKPGTNNQSFSLTTWPGHLAFSGDMGIYVFAQVRDMFEFFRPDGHSISYSYWAEKCMNVDGHRGLDEFDPDAFNDYVHEVLRYYLEDGFDESSDISRKELIHQVEEEVLSEIHDGQTHAMAAAMNFKHGRHRIFQNIWDSNLRRYSYSYVWCANAIQWGIGQYDERMMEEALGH